LSEAALEHGLLSPFQLDPIRRDLEVSLPGLRACRQLLVVIPASSVKHSARSGCRVRLIHSIIDYQPGIRGRNNHAILKQLDTRVRTV
jgi:hypothetical protein